MFESIPRDSTSQRIRTAAVPPMAAFLFAQFCFLIEPMLPRVPAALYWTVVAVLGGGGIAGAVQLVRVLRAHRPRATGLGWVAGAVLLDLICLWLFVEMTIPWLP